jgi:hypothetical protein
VERQEGAAAFWLALRADIPVDLTAPVEHAYAARLGIRPAPGEHVHPARPGDKKRLAELVLILHSTRDALGASTGSRSTRAERQLTALEQFNHLVSKSDIADHVAELMRTPWGPPEGEALREALAGLEQDIGKGTKASGFLKPARFTDERRPLGDPSLHYLSESSFKALVPKFEVFFRSTPRDPRLDVVEFVLPGESTPVAELEYRPDGQGLGLVDRSHHTFRVFEARTHDGTYLIPTAFTVDPASKVLRIRFSPGKGGGGKGRDESWDLSTLYDIREKEGEFRLDRPYDRWKGTPSSR